MLVFQGKCHKFLFLFFFSFFLDTLVFFFFFLRLIGLFRDPNLLKVVKSTRPDFCKVQEVRQFFSLYLKTNVHSV